MKKMNATHDLTIGEQRQLDKQRSKQRYYNRKRDKRIDGEKRLHAVGSRVEVVEDEELADIDLRRVTKLSDLNIDR
jgi:hypothetical protein